MKLVLYYIGKARDAHANAMAEEYIKRSQRFIKCEMREIRPDQFDLRAKHPSATKILLDPQGRAVDSSGFTQIVHKAESEARDLVFVIGGADGLPPDWKAEADLSDRFIADDHATRTRPRGAGGANLPRAYDAAWSSLSSIMKVCPVTMRCSWFPSVVLRNTRT